MQFSSKVGRDRDHIIPKSFFERPVPGDAELPIVDSCRACNVGFSGAEDRVRNALIASVPPGVARAFPELASRGRRGFARRPATIELRAMRTLAGVDVLQRIPLDEGLQQDLQRVFEKIVRGLYYFHRGAKLLVPVEVRQLGMNAATRYSTLFETLPRYALGSQDEFVWSFATIEGLPASATAWGFVNYWSGVIGAWTGSAARVVSQVPSADGLLVGGNPDGVRSQRPRK